MRKCLKYNQLSLELGPVHYFSIGDRLVDMQAQQENVFPPGEGPPFGPPPQQQQAAPGAPRFAPPPPWFGALPQQPFGQFQGAPRPPMFGWPGGMPMPPQLLAPPKLYLPDFWPKQPAPWFELAESHLQAAGVFAPRQMFNMVLPFLPATAIGDLGDILAGAATAANPYLDLKEEMIRRFTPCVAEQLDGIIFAPELGGQRPSQLMRSMLSMLPLGEQPGLLFKRLFVLKLPADIQPEVSKKISRLTARELAEYADSRWDNRNSVKKNVAVVTAKVAACSLAAEEDGGGTIAAVTAKGSKGKNIRGKKQQKKKKEQTLCDRHTRFGERAWECDDPDTCSMAGNVSAGGQ